MAIINRIADFHADMTQWRRRIHARPETAFEEHETAAFVAAQLQSFGIEVNRGLAGTGVVGTLQGRTPGGRAIALGDRIREIPAEVDHVLGRVPLIGYLAFGEQGCALPGIPTHADLSVSTLVLG